MHSYTFLHVTKSAEILLFFSFFVNNKEDYMVYGLKLGAEIGGFASLLLGVSIYHLVDLILR